MTCVRDVGSGTREVAEGEGTCSVACRTGRGSKL